MMNIHIGDKLGSQYEYYRYYLPFVIKTDIRFVKPYAWETIIHRQYEMFEDFIPYNHDVVLDVGAYYGDYSIIWNKLYGAKVYAFEPSFFNYLVAKVNIALNKSSVILSRFAIGNEDKIIIMYGDNMINKFINNGLEQTVEMIKLDNYFGVDLFETVDLIKIDVEGYELEALVGAEKTLKDFKPKIILETHTFDLKRLCTTYLQNLGYELKHIGREQTGTGAMDLISELYFEVKK